MAPVTSLKKEVAIQGTGTSTPLIANISTWHFGAQELSKKNIGRAGRSTSAANDSGFVCFGKSREKRGTSKSEFKINIPTECSIETQYNILHF